MEEYLITNPEIVLKEELEEGLLFNPETGEIKLLNETGVFIYKLLDGKTSKNDIIDKVIVNFDIEEKKQAEKDVEEFLKMLFESQLIGWI